MVRPCTYDTGMSMEKKSSCQSSSTPPTAESKSSSAPATTTTITRPSWLLSTIADLDERMKAIEAINSEEDSPEDTFAQRAESYYRKRPQLLSLLQDLYNAYLSLSDRYLRGLVKRKRNRVKQSPSQLSFGGLSDQDDGEIDSEAESTLSYQKPPSTPGSIKMSVDMLIAELVMKNVEHDLLLHEVNMMECRRGESSRKMELQENLLEVLESERMILLSQNSALGYQVAALVEENRVLATESELMKTRAEELARCVWKIREEGCVGELSSKIDELQGRIFGLEEKNKEYFDEIVRKGMQFEWDTRHRERSPLGCFEFEKWKLKRERAAIRKSIEYKKAGAGKKKKVVKWWAKVKNMDIFKCGISPTCGQ
ncbi:kinase-interacting family protein isoform X2 [Punica granatum]|uniref:Kinase-interacting family protein isoform X2 n=1 Tax=Punica granatum TaxID=22663 RepID=A0A6P8EJ43_PUNGR|nr:kinase-interacting family protein isoform X2 [Punica granatum]